VVYVPDVSERLAAVAWLEAESTASPDPVVLALSDYGDLLPVVQMCRSSSMEVRTPASMPEPNLPASPPLRSPWCSLSATITRPVKGSTGVGRRGKRLGHIDSMRQACVRPIPHQCIVRAYAASLHQACVRPISA
jgi:hypothetical protein